MKIIIQTSTFILACLASGCANEKWGDYTVLHTQEFGDGYVATLLQSDEGIRLNVELNGAPISETEVTEKEITMVTSPYLREGVRENPDSLTIWNDGNRITSALWLREGGTKYFIVDKNGDGFPESRARITESESTIESIDYTSTPLKRTRKSNQTGDDNSE